jgi:L-asparagine oxygenase
MQSQRNIDSSSRFEVDLAEADRDVIWEAIQKIHVYDPVAETEQFVTEAQLQMAHLPEPLRRELLRFRRFGNAVGGLLIHGVPTGAVPPTPEHADDAVGATLPAASAMSLFAAVLGEQYGFRPELGGNVIQDILPVVGFEETQQSISSKKELFDHVEMAFTDFRADYVGLFCVRQDHEKVAGTTLSSVERMLPLLDRSVVKTLREPRYKTTVDGSFLRGFGIETAIWIGAISVLDGPSERPRLRADFAETKGIDPKAQAALDALLHVAKQAKATIELAEGDLLFIDNHHAFHGRTSFRARWDGQDRWLLRTFVTRDLARSITARPGDGRIIDTDYSDGPDVLPTEVKIRRAGEYMPIDHA